MNRSVLAIAALVLTGCTMLNRARTYPHEAEITAVDWYRPLETVAGRATGASRAASPRAGGPSAESLEDARAWAAERATTGLVVLHRGELVYEWYADGFSAQSTTNAQSMSKTVAALLLGSAVADGHIRSVDAPVAEYVPELASDDRREITFRHLLEMTSGLRNDDEMKRGSDLVRMHIGTQVERAALSIPSERLPGYAFDYNNANTQLLAIAIERATGRRYAEYLSERLWRPLGASDAAVWLDRRGGDAKAYCCLFATARDWARVGQLMLDGGRVNGMNVVPRDWITRMTMPSPRNPDYGWQLWRYEGGVGSTRADDRTEPFLDRATFWLDGRGAQRVYVLPRSQLVIVRVGERPADWDDAFLPNTLVRGLPAPAADGR